MFGFSNSKNNKDIDIWKVIEEVQEIIFPKSRYFVGAKTGAIPPDLWHCPHLEIKRDFPESPPAERFKKLIKSIDIKSIKIILNFIVFSPFVSC
jgi:hypothetical protein